MLIHRSLVPPASRWLAIAALLTLSAGLGVIVRNPSETKSDHIQTSWPGLKLPRQTAIRRFWVNALLAPVPPGARYCVEEGTAPQGYPILLWSKDINCLLWRIRDGLVDAVATVLTASDHGRFELRQVDTPRDVACDSGPVRIGPIPIGSPGALCRSKGAVIIWLLNPNIPYGNIPAWNMEDQRPGTITSSILVLHEVGHLWAMLRDHFDPLLPGTRNQPTVLSTNVEAIRIENIVRDRQKLPQRLAH